MREIIEAISRKRKQMSAIQSDIEALEKALKIVDGESDTMRTPGRPSGVSNKTSTLTVAADILRDKGQPTHIDDIIEAFDRDVKKTSLASSLFRDVKSKTPTFTKVVPNTFGLAVWETPKSNKDALAETQGNRQGALSDGASEGSIPFGSTIK